jgi:hypothetical protein
LLRLLHLLHLLSAVQPILGAGYAQAQDDPKALVERAIKAHGGEAKVAKLKVMTIKVKGKMTFLPGLGGTDLLIDDTWHMPSQYKSAMRLKHDGQDVEFIKVVNGDKGWVSSWMGMVQPMTKEDLAEFKEQKYAEDLERLGFLQDNRYTLATIKDSISGLNPSVGVKITSKGHREVTLYFDMASSLLIGRRHFILEAGKEILQEVFYEDFEDQDGLTHYTRLVGKRDGKNFFEGEVAEIKFFEKLDEKVFARPSPRDRKTGFAKPAQTRPGSACATFGKNICANQSGYITAKN